METETDIRRGAVRATELLGSQVAFGNVRLGLVRDVLFGVDLGVVLGLVIETESGPQSFLPWPGARPAQGAVLVSSPALLLGEMELAYYAASGIRLTDVIGMDVETDEQGAMIRNVTFDSDGTTADVVVANGAERAHPVAVGDLRVHWSAGALPRLALARRSRRRRGPAAETRLGAAAGEHVA